jgi:hypothetical protein
MTTGQIPDCISSQEQNDPGLSCDVAQQSQCELLIGR